MRMKFATINRNSNDVVGLFDGEAEAYSAMLSYEAADRANNSFRFNQYYVSMMIMDHHNKVLIRGRNH
ncbi:MAG: hypothetical protein K6G04_02785 [Lachnospiraceae bacterium]|nr:hypothetical protein [Lachnospiraceae bacterium]